MISNALAPTLAWIKEDYASWPTRFILELVAWVLSIGANLMFAFTVPYVPFTLYLSITITGCAIYAWAAYTRKSFGMLANYLLLTAIDTTGFIRILL